MNLTAMKITALQSLLDSRHMGGFGHLPDDVGERVAELIQQKIDSLTKLTTVPSLGHHEAYDVIVFYPDTGDWSMGKSMPEVVDKMLGYAEHMGAPCKIMWGPVPLIVSPLDTPGIALARWEIARVEGSVVKQVRAAQAAPQSQPSTGD
jgi:hypothetical protein